MLYVLKDSENSPLPLFHVMSNLEKLFHTLMTRTDLANLPETLNKRTGGLCLTIFWMIVARYIQLAGLSNKYPTSFQLVFSYQITAAYIYIYIPIWKNNQMTKYVPSFAKLVKLTRR